MVSEKFAAEGCDEVDVVLSSGFLSFANHAGFLRAVEEVRCAVHVTNTAGTPQPSLECTVPSHGGPWQLSTSASSGVYIHTASAFDTLGTTNSCLLCDASLQRRRSPMSIACDTNMGVRRRSSVRGGGLQRAVGVIGTQQTSGTPPTP